MTAASWNSAGVSVPLVERLLRAVALLIVILAIVNPQLSGARRTRPLIAVAGSLEEPSAQEKLLDELTRDNVIVSGIASGVDATVVLDPGFAPLVPAVAPVISTDLSARVRVVRVDHPDEVIAGDIANLLVSVEARSPVDSLRLEVRKGGVLLDTRTIEVDHREPLQRATLSFVTATPGIQELDVIAIALPGDGGSDGARTDAVPIALDVTAKRYRIHFEDARASWLSTFVRRNAELDRRFEVSSRVTASRGISVIGGDAGRGMGDLSSLSDADLLVLGAPEQLSQSAINSVRSFLRDRGGSVLLLFDRASAGLTGALTGVDRWRTGTLREARDVLFTGANISTPDAETGEHIPAFKAGEWMAPISLPPGVRVLARSSDADSTPLLFALPYGAGTLYVSTALDSWKYRDPEISRFAGSWNAILLEAASSSIPALESRIEPAANHPAAPFSALSGSTRLLLGGSPYNLRVTARQALAGAAPLIAAESVSVSAGIIDEGADTVGAIRLLPTALPGEFIGRFVAPRTPGVYRVDVLFAVQGDTFADTLRFAAAVPDSGFQRPPALVTSPWGSDGSRRSALEALAVATGGALVETPRGVAESIRGLVRTPEARIQWYPMRSSWWILPLTVLLGAEWWLRRRRGLP